MDVELTRTGKYSLIAHAPVMPAAGTFGYGDRYTRLIKTEKFGAFVTNPISLSPRRHTRQTHVIPMPGGLLLHTGLPNQGANKIVKKYKKSWDHSPVPVIAHVIDRDPVTLRRCVRSLLDASGIQAFELGLHHATTVDEVYDLVDAVMHTTDLPLLVRLPLERAVELAPVVADTDAGAVVVGAPPRGMVMDPVGGKPITGRLYGPLVKPLALRTVADVVAVLEGSDLPVIGAGGIHTANDAREFIRAGARAVQLDSVIWAHPQQAEIIARDLGGLILTKEVGAYPDEWFPGMGQTHQQGSIPPLPPSLPE